MNSSTTHAIPKTGWKGLIQNWRSDLLAAVSVSFVALPLGLGVALASGAPPISGLISAIIGGVVTTFFRGSHLTINGPAAGLIAVILSAIATLDDGSGQTLNYVLAACCIAGAIQVLLGFLKLGKVAEIIPSSVIQGVMVAIGIIIFSSQIHIALGTKATSKKAIGQLMEVFEKLPDINPFVLIISLIGLSILILVPKIQSRLFQFFPASLWVLIVAVPLVYIFGFTDASERLFLGRSYAVGPEYLINIPDNLLDAFLFPNFSKIGTLPFWLAVISISLIASIQTLAMAKAVDNLDPYRRKSNLDKDLIGVGMGTMVSCAVGGLPLITVIVRSTVNVHNNAKTKWSNFYHGLLLIGFILLLSPVIQKVPLAALAAILVFIGFKLAAPKVFRNSYGMGMEQLLFLIVTIGITLYSDLLWGILGGTAVTLLVHILLARVPIASFFRMAFWSGSNVFRNKDGSYLMKIKGIANFLTVLNINRLTEHIPPSSEVTIDLSETRLVDLTVMENILAFKREMDRSGGQVRISGFDEHVASTAHQLALKIRPQPMARSLSPRQMRLKNIADTHQWGFRSEVDLDTSYLRNFQFFETRPIEQKTNVISGSYPNRQIQWEIADITFDEGFLISSEVHKTTVQVIHLSEEIPKFVLEREGFFDKVFDRVMAFSGYKDIDFELFTKFSKQFLLMGEKEEEIRAFFTPDLLQFLEQNNIQHIESNGEALLVFNYLRLARSNEITNMLEFSESLVQKMA
jgi:MFS superfamily sulfate permease-like transporter